MNVQELNQVMTNISMMFDFENIENGVVIAPDGNRLVGGPFVKFIEVCPIGSSGYYLLKPNNKFWCYLSILKRDKGNPYVFTEVKNLVHYTEFNELGFDKEIICYNNNSGIVTEMADLVNFDKHDFLTTFIK